MMQSIHFVDPATDASYNTRTAWRNHQFGSCDGLIERVLRLCRGA